MGMHGAQNNITLGVQYDIGTSFSTVLFLSVFRGYSAKKKFARILDIKRQQEKHVFSFLLNVEDHLIPTYTLLVEQCDHDQNRYDDMIQQKLEEEVQLRAMEDGKR
jgi:hypothetical protein